MPGTSAESSSSFTSFTRPAPSFAAWPTLASAFQPDSVGVSGAVTADDVRRRLKRARSYSAASSGGGSSFNGEVPRSSSLLNEDGSALRPAAAAAVKALVAAAAATSTPQTDAAPPRTNPSVVTDAEGSSHGDPRRASQWGGGPTAYVQLQHPLMHDGQLQHPLIHDGLWDDDVDYLSPSYGFIGAQAPPSVSEAGRDDDVAADSTAGSVAHHERRTSSPERKRSRWRSPPPRSAPDVDESDGGNVHEGDDAEDEDSYISADGRDRDGSSIGGYFGASVVAASAREAAVVPALNRGRRGSVDDRFVDDDSESGLDDDAARRAVADAVAAARVAVAAAALAPRSAARDALRIMTLADWRSAKALAKVALATARATAAASAGVALVPLPPPVIGNDIRDERPMRGGYTAGRGGELAKYQPGVILRLSGVPLCIPWSVLRDALAAPGGLAYIDCPAVYGNGVADPRLLARAAAVEAAANAVVGGDNDDDDDGDEVTDAVVRYRTPADCMRAADVLAAMPITMLGFEPVRVEHMQPNSAEEHAYWHGVRARQAEYAARKAAMSVMPHRL